MFWKIFAFLAAFLTASTAFAQGVSQWHDDLNGSYYSGGSGNTDYLGMLWGVLLGVFVMRMWEKNQDIDEGWLRTIFMSFWFCTPVSIGFVAMVFY